MPGPVKGMDTSRGPSASRHPVQWHAMPHTDACRPLRLQISLPLRNADPLEFILSLLGDQTSQSLALPG